MIDEYAIVPCVSASLFGLEHGDEGGSVDEGCLALEHKLALSVEAALLLYRHGSRILRSGTSADMTSVLAASKAVLLASADHARAWQKRGDVLRREEVDFEAELRFSALLLRTSHKSGETWARRRHLLALAFQETPTNTALAFAKAELTLVEEVAKKYDHHYYAWNHWSWVESFCARLPQLRGRSPDHGPGSPIGDMFPRLAHATPSHYGLFHHRVVRLRSRFLAGSGNPERGVSSCRVEGDSCVQASCPGAFVLPPDLLDIYSEERKLSSSLLSTFPHLEAPWAFRVQLLTVLLEAAEAMWQHQDPCRTSVHSIADLWRSERGLARALEAEGVKERGTSACRGYSLRFRCHALHEVAMSLELLGGIGAASQVVEEGLGELEELASCCAAAPAVLRDTRICLRSAMAGTAFSN